MTGKNACLMGWTLLCLCSVVWGVVPTEEELASAAERFRTEAQLAKLDMLPTFTAAKEAIRKSRALTPDARAQALAALEQQQAEFEQSGVLVDSPALKRGLVKFRKAMEQSTAHLDKVFQEYIKERANAGDGAGADKARNWRNDLVIGPGYELVGKWQLLEGRSDQGFRELFVVTKQFGQWSVERTFVNDSGLVAGSTFGSDFKLVGGKLEYIEHYRKKPVDSWDDNCRVSIGLVDGSTERAENRFATPGGLTGVHSLVRVQP